MHERLTFVSALAAAAGTASAIGLQTEQISSDAMQSLLSIYANCEVQAALSVKTADNSDGSKTSTLSIDFSGIDTNCPDLTATVWMETPDAYQGDAASAEEFSITLTPDQVVNGVYTHEFTSKQVTGTYYFHTTVTPYGFECALPLLDTCTDDSA